MALPAWLNALLSFWRPRPPVTRAVWVHVGETGALVTLERVNPFFDQTMRSASDGIARFEQVPNFPGDAINLSVSAPGFVPYTSIGHPLPPGNQDILVMLLPLPIVVPPEPLPPPLVVEGHVFRLSTGSRWTAIEATDFQLFQRFLRGENIDPVLAQRQAVGFNLLRVFGMCHNLFPLDPVTAPDYAVHLPMFLRRVANYALRVEFVVFPDCAIVMPDRTTQQAHWARVCETLRPFASMVLVELQNEEDQSANDMDPTAFSAPAGLLASHGSNGSEQQPVRPWWGYETFHTNDAFEWQRKVGHNAMELTDGDPEGHITPSHVPVIANENTRFTDRANRVELAYDAAAGAALLCAGSCFHSIKGKSSELWEGAELDCAKAWVAGARSVDLSQQHEPYLHRADLEGPSDLRVYQRGSAIVRIRR